MAYASSDVDCSEEAKMLSEPRNATRSVGNYFWRPSSVILLVGIVASTLFLTFLVAFKANVQPTASPAKPVLKLIERELQPTLELCTVELQLPGPWINRQQLPKEETGRLISATPPATTSSAADGRRLSSSCDSSLDHLITVGEQGKQGLTPPDEIFPASASSIAPPGANCGDTAKNQHVSCAKYNVWTTFQDVAEAKNKPFDVIGKSGPNWHDIGQGELGVCYFLSALASVAHDDPMVISRMFVEREKEAQGVYTTKWFINGHETHVAVDNKVPGQGSRAFFAQPSDTGEWWPVILEKAWAKIFENYKATEAGIWVNPVLAITGAPVFRVAHDEDLSDDALWKVLQDATTEHWPAGTGTKDSQTAVNLGLVLGHAYSVFNASVQDGKKVIQVYNPWGVDNYKGSIANSNKADGIFQMTLAEYKASFHSTTFAHVHTSFAPSSKKIQTTQSKASAWEFNVASSDKFYVSVTWPNARMTRQCTQQQPKVTLAVSKKGSSSVQVAEEATVGTNSQSVKITEGAGDYVASVVVDFPSDQVHQAHLVFYGKDQVSITPSSGNADHMVMSLIGPAEDGKACSTISLPELGLFVMDTNQRVNGLPTFWGHDGALFAYWEPRSRQWWAVTKAKLALVQAGELWSTAKFGRDDVICGCRDDPDGVGGFSGGVYCNQVKGQAAKYGNVRCESTEYSKLVQRFCPVTCGVPVCSEPATTPVPTATPGPTPAPTLAPPGGTGSQCLDRTDTQLKVDDKPVTCADTDFCKVPGFEEHCCSSCAKAAENGDVSGGSCEDQSPAGISIPGTEISICSRLKGQCSKAVIRDRCCATCKAHDENSSGHASLGWCCLSIFCLLLAEAAKPMF